MQNSHFFKIKKFSKKCPFCYKLLWTIPKSTLKEKLEKHCFRSFIDKSAHQKLLNIVLLHRR